MLHRAPVVRAGEDRARADWRPPVDSPGARRGPGRALVVGVPPDLEFRTKGQLAMGIFADGYADGIDFDVDFACGGRSTAAALSCGSSSSSAGSLRAAGRLGLPDHAARRDEPSLR
jgi:hypothetical protein